MNDKLRPDQSIHIPLPVRCRSAARPTENGIAAGAVSAHEGPTVFHPAFESGALVFGQRVAAGVIPDDHLDLPQLLLVHDRAVFRNKEWPCTLVRDCRKRGIGGLDRCIVTKAIGLGENQNAARFQIRRQHGRLLVECWSGHETRSPTTSTPTAAATGFSRCAPPFDAGDRRLLSQTQCCASDQPGYCES